ncbi:DNA polymerase III subunit beta [Spirulina subsalsa FACHB-351]|uniref:Beta sliding clamp n=1 Tax=Spirulina subsalsa FACHB-351 TaxID=234711 RepID=A0ABT3L2G9_9CYAN|nr:DNA polymerase III subunit beta [Spirulina subsalsa]MCW6035382.1 DNA polymerase III subunit beta [Spirulina subsalsa FACHB-351]
MKLVCSQSDLNTNLSLVSRAVPSRPTHPVLGNVLLIADEDTQKVSLRGFDLSLGIQTSFPAEVSEGGIITLPAKTLGDIVSKLPEGEITLAQVEETEDEGENTIITLTSTFGSYKLRSMDPEEFPDLPIVEDGESISLPVQALSEGLRSTIFAASTEETKQVLTGVHVTLGNDAIEFAATDGHRLAVVETPNESGSETAQAGDNFEVTIPARTLRELERMLTLRENTDSVMLHVDESQIVFELGNQRITSRKLEGAYPAYRQLIPQQFGNQINVDRRQFQSALERISVLADSKNNVVRCVIDHDNQQLFLSVESQDLGSGRESMSAQITSSNPPEVAFNVKYLMDGLKALSSVEICIHLNAPTQPVIFTPLSGLKMTYLAMPVQLRD